MSKKSAKPSKKKATSSSTNQKRSSTQSKASTSPTYVWEMVDMWNSRGTSIGKTAENWNLSLETIPKCNYTFSFLGTTPSGEEVNYFIRIGPNGLEYLTQWGEEYRKIG